MLLRIGMHVLPWAILTAVCFWKSWVWHERAFEPGVFVRAMRPGGHPCYREHDRLRAKASGWYLLGFACSFMVGRMMAFATEGI